MLLCRRRHSSRFARLQRKWSPRTRFSTRATESTSPACSRAAPHRSSGALHKVGAVASAEHGRHHLATFREPLFLLFVVAAAFYLALGDLSEGLFLSIGAAVSVRLVVHQ